MSTVGVRELKNRLTRYLRETKKGGEIVVTERGNPIAVIQPIRHGRRATSLEGRLAELAARGIVTLPNRKARKGSRLVIVKGAPLSRTVLEDRR
ncbi:MAG TPA: type II toxin-antitoxin system prevent-host-death family antitoxin [Thermoanaerobaculia bacterium]|nr:type II toxin-antitoxin system prevent-host-death family antitoxin [Thermoanaerobaculia bacterium]